MDRSDPGRSSESESVDADSTYIRMYTVPAPISIARQSIGVRAAIFVRLLPDYPQRVLCSNSENLTGWLRLKDRGMACTCPCDSHWKAASSSSAHTTWSLEFECK